MQLKRLYQHILFYVLVIGMLAALNFATSPHFLWFLFPAAGWGLGLGLHIVGRSRMPGQLGVYVMVIGFLAFINVITNPNHLWFLWPAAVWGFIIAIGFVGRNAFGREWEKRKIRQYMGKE